MSNAYVLEDGEILSPNEDDVFYDGFDKDYLGDENDKIHMINLNEREREMEIYRRRERREILKTRWQVLKKLEQSRLSKTLVHTDKENMACARMKNDVFLEKRKLKNQSNVNNKFLVNKQLQSRYLAFEKLRNGRKKEAQKAATNSATATVNPFILADNNLFPQKSPTCFWSKPEHVDLRPRIQSCAELNKLRISRYRLEKYYELSIFKKTIRHLFVRLSIGLNVQKYCVAEITDVCEMEHPYQFGKKITKIGLRLKFALQQKVYPMHIISNGVFTEEEFSYWQVACLTKKVSMPLTSQIEEKFHKINKAEEAERKANESKFEHNKFAMKKIILYSQHKAAISQNEFDKAKKIKEKIELIEMQAQNQYQKFGSHCRGIAYINERNRRLNIEGAERALREECQDPLPDYDDPCARRQVFSYELSPDSEDKRRVKVAEKTLFDLHDFDIDIDTSHLPIYDYAEDSENSSLLSIPDHSLKPKKRRNIDLNF